MQTLKQQIEECEYEIRQRQYAIDQYRLKLRSLEVERFDCEHEFTAPIKGYEHEGGTCVKCGINQVHAESRKVGAKYK